MDIREVAKREYCRIMGIDDLHHSTNIISHNNEIDFKVDFYTVGFPDMSFVLNENGDIHSIRNIGFKGGIYKQWTVL